MSLRGSRRSASVSRSTTEGEQPRSRHSGCLPLDELKIDTGFIHALGRSETDAALVRGLIDIGHALGLKVVAEGVETREAWNLLADWGCDFAQGYYVAGPRPANELVDWLRGSWPAVA